MVDCNIPDSLPFHYLMKMPPGKDPDPLRPVFPGLSVIMSYLESETPWEDSFPLANFETNSNSHDARDSTVHLITLSTSREERSFCSSVIMSPLAHAPSHSHTSWKNNTTHTVVSEMMRLGNLIMFVSRVDLCFFFFFCIKLLTVILLSLPCTLSGD